LYQRLQSSLKEDKKRNYTLVFKNLQTTNVIFIVCVISWDEKNLSVHAMNIISAFLHLANSTPTIPALNSTPGLLYSAKL